MNESFLSRLKKKEKTKFQLIVEISNYKIMRKFEITFMDYMPVMILHGYIFSDFSAFDH